jgi:hypothetical protein
MATEAAHIAVANANQRTLDHLRSDIGTHGPWVAVVAFYKALHIVEAVFANDKDIRHTCDHGQRERTLKTTNRYSQINKHYAPLARAATIARYLHDGSKEYSSFFDYMRGDQIEPELLNHRLHQVEECAAGFLKSSDSLSRVNRR